MREQSGHDGDEVSGHIVKAVNGIHAPIEIREDFSDIAVVRQKKPPQSGYIRRYAPAGSVQARLHHTGARATSQLPVDRPMPVESARRWIEEFFDGLADFSIKKGHRATSGCCLRALSDQTPWRERGAIRMICSGHPACCCVRQAPSSFMAWRYFSSPCFLLPGIGKRGWRTIRRGCPPCAGRPSASG
jgi:hypothetical protein